MLPAKSQFNTFGPKMTNLHDYYGGYIHFRLYMSVTLTTSDALISRKCVPAIPLRRVAVHGQ